MERNTRRTHSRSHTTSEATRNARRGNHTGGDRRSHGPRPDGGRPRTGHTGNSSSNRSGVTYTRPQHRATPNKDANTVVSSGKRPMRRMRGGAPRTAKKTGDVQPIAEGVIRIIPIGGVEQVGQNMTAIEIGNDIIVIDAGFQFKDETTPGIDYIIPNTKYLEENKDKIRGLFITHGHLDHIGAVPYVIEKIGNPPMYTREFGAIMIKKRHEEFPHLPKPNIVTLDGDETISIGDSMKIETFAISHTIPDSMGLVIHTAQGDIVFIEDVRVDNIEGVPTEEEVQQYKRFKDKEVLLLTMDSTSVEKPGWSLSESVVVQNIEKIIKSTEGRLIIGTFASQVERILAVIHLASKYNKKVVIEGRSMKSNVEIIKFLKLLKTDNIIQMSEIENYPPDRVVMLVTGAQGEEFAALMRMANKTHKHIELRETDTILLSSSIIPTNHASVVRLKDHLYRSKARIITYLDSDVHASGHGNREELSWIHNQINYRYFIPVHGNHYMLRQHAELAITLGAKRENVVVPDNGSIIEISENGTKFEKLPVRVPHELVTVDGYSVSDMRDIVLRDRQLLSEAGIFMIVASINTRTGKLKKSPDIISRGFVYLRESQDLLNEARDLIRRTIERNLRPGQQVDFEKMKKVVSETVSKFLFQKTAKEPLVIPVILGV